MTGPPATHDERLRAELASLRIDRDAVPRRARQRPRRRWWWWGVVLVLLGAAAYWKLTAAPAVVSVATVLRSTAAQAGPLPVLSGSGYIVTGGRSVSIGVR